MKKLYTINAKRWFDRINGNTYHSVRVYKNNKEIGFAPFEYGYDEGYLQTAFTLLQNAGEYKITGERCNGSDIDYMNFTEDRRTNREKFLIIVNDVKRKKDLI